MDEANMMRYFRYWSIKHSDNFPKMLIYDSFSAHITSDVKDSFKNNNTDLVNIPGGLTSICQPLDVSINKPFKNNLRFQWHNWMASGGNGITKGSNLKRASLYDACQWVLKTWQEISPDIIVHAFKKCGISNALDGTDDDILFE